MHKLNWIIIEEKNNTIEMNLSQTTMNISGDNEINTRNLACVLFEWSRAGVAWTMNASPCSAFEIEIDKGRQAGRQAGVLPVSVWMRPSRELAANCGLNAHTPTIQCHPSIQRGHQTNRRLPTASRQETAASS